VTLGQQLCSSLVLGDGIVKVTLHSGIVRLAGNRHVTSCTLGGIVRCCEQSVEGDGLGRGLSTGLSCGGCCGWSKLDGCTSDCIQLLVLVEMLLVG
jgi:hypothetical protein